MDFNGFQKLIVWQKAHVFVLEIYKITKVFPDDEKFSLTNQIRRSGVSICANIAEGSKKGKKEFARFLDISQGSLEETKYYLILSQQLGYCEANYCNQLLTQANEIGKMLTGLSQRLKN